ncbi:Alpha/Beta hydrolase protein [Aspergillus floccosus]
MFFYTLYYLLASLTPLCAAQPDATNRTISPELFTSLAELARVVDITYCVGDTGTGIQKPFECLSHCRDLEGFELITTWHTGPFLTDSSGYIAFAHNPPKRIIVAFRGTYSLPNTILDLSAYPQPYTPYQPPDGDSGKGCENCTVHTGFLTSWHAARRTVLYHVSSARERYPEYTVEVVGHSLGGAVAALAGTEMVLRGWRPRVTTFGEPRVGNEALARFVDGVFGLDGGVGEKEFRRVTHVDDPVPLLPAAEWGFAMHAGEVFISKEGLAPGVEDVVFCEGDADVRCIAGADTDSELGSRGQRQRQVVLSARGSLWDLVPAKYRLWELLFAHRDYFLRLGLCVPGGDPTG